MIIRIHKTKTSLPTQRFAIEHLTCTPQEIEVIMMIGLPGAGKTTYAKKQLSEKPDKRYYILGQDMVMGHLRNAALRRYKLKYVLGVPDL